MYKVRKQFTFPIGHRLMKHQGLCKNFHGHNILLEVQIRCAGLNKNNMIIDFHDLKKEIGKIIDVLDHAAVLNGSDDEYIEKLKDQKLLKLNQNIDPTAEILAEFIFMEILTSSTIVKAPIQLDFVRVWENDRSMAEFSVG